MIVSLFAVALLIPPLVSAQEIKKGDQATVLGWTSVDVKNLDPVENSSASFSYSMSCGIHHGGTVTVVGIDGNRLLVRYSIGSAQNGMCCPTGVLFFTTKETFSKMKEEYRQIRAAEQNEKNLVKRLIKKK